MTTQPEALRLADALTTPPDCTCRATSYFECGCDAIWPEQWIDHAAAELRRLHAENERLHQINQSHEMKLSVRGYEIQIADLEAQRDALLEALKLIVEFVDAPTEGKRPDVFVMRISKARAAIKAAEEKE